MTAASPGVISLFFRNDYTRAKRLSQAIATAMTPEYEAIVAADSTFSSTARTSRSAVISNTPISNSPIFERAAEHVEALNTALEAIPADRIDAPARGNYEGPHHCDVPLIDILDVVLRRDRHAILGSCQSPTRPSIRRVREGEAARGKVLIPA